LGHIFFRKLLSPTIITYVSGTHIPHKGIMASNLGTLQTTNLEVSIENGGFCFLK